MIIDKVVLEENWLNSHWFRDPSAFLSKFN